jgi:hypothetical protein
MPPQLTTRSASIVPLSSPCCQSTPVTLPPALLTAGDLHALDDLRTVLPCTLGQRHGDIGRIALPVERQVHSRRDVGDVEMRIHLQHFVRADFLDVDVEGARQRRLAKDLFLARLCQRHGDRAALPHAGGNAGFLLQLDVEIGRVLGEPRSC